MFFSNLRLRKSDYDHVLEKAMYYVQPVQPQIDYRLNNLVSNF